MRLPLFAGAVVLVYSVDGVKNLIDVVVEIDWFVLGSEGAGSLAQILEAFGALGDGEGLFDSGVENFVRIGLGSGEALAEMGEAEKSFEVLGAES